MRIRVADVPPGMTVFQYIRSRCDHDRLAARCVPRVGRRARLSFDLGGTDLTALRAEVEAALARWALRDLPEWTGERIDSAMAGNRQILVPLPRKIPVYLVYQSVVVRESGEAFLYPDIYGHDRTLDVALRKGYPFAGTALASPP